MRKVLDTGVGDTDVNLAVVLLGLFHEIGDGVDVCNVALESNGSPTVRGDFGDDLVGFGLATGVDDDDRGAFGSEAFNDLIEKRRKEVSGRRPF